MQRMNAPYNGSRPRDYDAGAADGSLALSADADPYEIGRAHAERISLLLSHEGAAPAVRYYLSQEFPPRVTPEFAAKVLTAAVASLGEEAASDVLRRAWREGPGMSDAGVLLFLSRAALNGDSASRILAAAGEATVPLSEQTLRGIAGYFSRVGGEYGPISATLCSFLDLGRAPISRAALRVDARVATLFDVQAAYALSDSAANELRSALFERLVPALCLGPALHLARSAPGLMCSAEGKALLTQCVSSNDAFLVLEALRLAEAGGASPGMESYQHAAGLAAKNGLIRAAAATFRRAHVRFGTQLLEAYLMISSNLGADEQLTPRISAPGAAPRVSALPGSGDPRR